MTRRRTKVGGKRKGAGRPRKDPADKRSEARTVTLTPAEAAAQDALAGETPWATWAHDALVAAAAPTISDT